MTKAVIGNKNFRVIGNYGFKNSNSEVTFNDIVIDFTNCTLEDIPYKYQEIKIIKDDEIIFTGFLDSIDLSHLSTNNKYKEMTLTLLSPLKMATKRHISLIGTFEIKEAIRRILQPLIEDGFELKEINTQEGQISLNFAMETIENAMNNIGFKRNIFWYIDEQKNIFVNSIDFLFGKNLKKKITVEKEKGLLELQPTIENIDYSNVINFKNVRLIYSTDYSEYPLIETGKKIKKGDTVTFKYPIILDETILREFIAGLDKNTNNQFWANIEIELDVNDVYYKNYAIGINLNDTTSANYNKYVKQGNITFNDDGGNDGEIILQRDSFFSNLITGFKWNIDKEVTINKARSNTALRYTTMKFVYSQEVEKLKGIISKSGQIEKIVDYAEKWTSLRQLIAYARSLMVQNSNKVNEVILEYDINPKIRVGDIVEINRPNYFTVGKFAVKDIEYTYINKLEQNWRITLKSSDLISSYIDMFRPEEQQENQDVVDTVILSEFIEETLNETHIVENYEDTETKVLRLAKEAWISEGYDLDGLVLVISGEVATDYYAVSVRDVETSASIGWIYVNTATGECEVEY